jgi:hypothetical protein
MNTPPNNNPLLQAFFLGRAAAELLSETVEKATTEILSEMGKFDAEQRVNLRNFVDQVTTRAEQARADMPTSATPGTGATTTGVTANSTIGIPNGNLGNLGNADLQATIDDLRAEIAEVRTELNRYRSVTNN